MLSSEDGALLPSLSLFYKSVTERSGEDELNCDKAGGSGDTSGSDDAILGELFPSLLSFCKSITERSREYELNCGKAVRSDGALLGDCGEPYITP